MKIIQINASYKPAIIYGGPTMSVGMLCEQLVSAGVKTTVLTTTANGKDDLPEKANANVDSVNVTYFKRITGDHTHFSPALLLKLWQEVNDYDLVHIHAWWNTVSVLSSLIALLRGVPVIVSPRGTLSPYSFLNKNQSVKKMIHRFLGKPILNKCHIHVTSEREKQAITQLIRPKSITTIPNFVKLPLNVNDGARLPATPLRLLFFSRIEEKKGLDILLESLDAVAIPYHLTIAGTGDSEYVNKLKKITTASSIEKYINWAGFVSENKFELMAEHDLLILPSHDENFANAVIESLSTGTAVLVSNKVGLFDYVQQKQLGWVCDTTVASISTLINKIGTDYHNELMRIRKEAPNIIYDDFDPRKLVKQYLTLYQQTLIHE